jgi:iron complex transport system substrate-binding protein
MTRRFISLLLITLLIGGGTAGIAGCSNPATDEPQNQPPASTTADDATWPRTYTDAAGRTVTLEKFPEKIVVDYLPYWEYLMALGITPAGASSAEHYRQTWDAFVDYDVSGVEDMGDPELNLEKLTALAPDLIFIATPDGVENLEKIAPVIVMDGQLKQDSRYALREFGKILGLEDEAEERIAQFDTQLAEDREKLSAALEGKTVVMLSVMGKDRYFSARRGEFYDPTLGLGFTAPTGYPEFGAGYQQVPLETLAEMNPDILFLAVFDGDEAIAEELQSNPVWQTIQAVKDGMVFTLDGTAHSTSIVSTEYTASKMVDFLLSQ